MDIRKLSPSALNLFIDCPRCFWLEKNHGIRRPRGIFPSLPLAMDLLIKNYFDKYRARNEMPPEIKGKLQGQLFTDIEGLTKWRSWFNTDLIYKDETLNATLSGALDDCLVENECYIPIDYKTRGSEQIEEPSQYYQNQLDCYCLILESSGFKTKGLAYLLYFWPIELHENGVVQFQISPVKLETNIDSAKEIFHDAIKCLDNNIPEASLHCEYCALVTARTKADM